MGEFRQLIDEVVDVDWRHPGWRLFRWGAALLEASAARRPRTDRLRDANTGRQSDTFMSRDASPARDCGELVATAVLRVRLTLDAMEKLDGQLPGQPLLQAIRDGHGRVSPVPLDLRDHRNVLFLTPGGPVLARVTAANERAVVSALAAERYRGTDCQRWLAAAAPPAALATSILPRPLAEAMHLHREAHLAGGGPWLAVGETQDGQEMVSTAHYGVDGYGHAWLCGEVFGALDRLRAHKSELCRVASRQVSRRLWSLSNPRRSDHPGFCGVVLDPPAARFAESAYAFALALESRIGSQRPGKYTPAFQVSVAPGDRADCARRRQRVLSGLLTLQRNGESLESAADFSQRLASWLDDERMGNGLLTRLRYAASGAPLPWALRRRLLPAQPRRRAWLPPATTLAGYGRISSMRFAAEEAPPAPLYAASFPPRGVFHGDPTGGVTLTLIHHADGRVTASAFGVGEFGSQDAARSFLDRWRDEVDAVMASPSVPAAAAGRP